VSSNPGSGSTGPPRSATVGVATAASAAVLWGLGTVASHVVLERGVSVAAFTLIEIGTSVVFLAVMCRILRTGWLSPREHWRIGLLGVLEPGLTYLVMNWGIAHTSVTHASLIGATEPLMIALLAWVLIRSPLPVRLFLPMGTALIGTILVVTVNADSSGATWLGDAAVALGFVFASLYAVGSSRFVADHPPLAVTFLQQLCAYAVIAPPLLIITAIGGVGTADLGTTWIAVPIIGIASSSVTFWLYLTSLRHVSPGTTAQFLALIPVTGFLGAVFILGEETSTPAFIGAAIVLVSLVTIARMEHRAEIEAYAEA
jgi:drug/metabolite transporter (DMT)-like permease